MPIPIPSEAPEPDNDADEPDGDVGHGALQEERINDVVPAGQRHDRDQAGTNQDALYPQPRMKNSYESLSTPHAA